MKQEWETLPEVAQVQLYVMGLIEELITKEMIGVKDGDGGMLPKGHLAYQQMRAANFHPSAAKVEACASFLVGDPLITVLIKTWYEKEVLEKSWPDEIDV